MRRVASVEFEPIYYMGWIVQPTIEGYEVYPRVDSKRNESTFFGDIRDAYTFIEGKVGLEGWK